MFTSTIILPVYLQLVTPPTSHWSPDTVTLSRISYCCADELFSHVFAFIAVNKDETMECHAFLCRKRKIVRRGGEYVSEN